MKIETIDLGNGAECVIYDGDKHWYLNNKLHRTDGPAVEMANGEKVWYLNDIQYSEEEFEMVKDLDNGAECDIDDYGNKFWYLNDKCHRSNGPAVEWADGRKYWYLNDKLHRTDGPALEDAEGNLHWYLNDKLHRTDGPAIEEADGDKYWFLNGIEYSEEDFEMAKLILWAV